jgi:hypothetical protein
MPPICDRELECLAKPIDDAVEQGRVGIDDGDAVGG